VTVQVVGDDAVGAVPENVEPAARRIVRRRRQTKMDDDRTQRAEASMSKVARVARLAQSGLTLIETAMVLGISSLVIAAALSLYAMLHDNERTATALVQMNTIQ
jgi:hypothetical protein